MRSPIGEVWAVNKIGPSSYVCALHCAHNTAQNRPDNFPSYPPDSHHCSDDVDLREGTTLLNGWSYISDVSDNYRSRQVIDHFTFSSIADHDVVLPSCTTI